MKEGGTGRDTGRKERDRGGGMESVFFGMWLHIYPRNSHHVSEEWCWSFQYCRCVSGLEGSNLLKSSICTT